MEIGKGLCGHSLLAAEFGVPNRSDPVTDFVLDIFIGRDHANYEGSAPEVRHQARVGGKEFLEHSSRLVDVLGNQ